MSALVATAGSSGATVGEEEPGSGAAGKMLVVAGNTSAREKLVDMRDGRRCIIGLRDENMKGETQVVGCFRARTRV